MPLALLHSRAAAEIGIVAIDLLYLASRPRPSGPFVWAAAAWWAWGVLTSLGTPGLPLAVALIRLPLFTLALGQWLLRPPARRRTLQLLLTLAAAWIAVECWQQALTGHNLFGMPRYGDGALTGPFAKPRAGPALILLFFPVVLPLAAAALARGRRFVAAAVLAAGTLTVLLIGQRMPALLLALGLVVTALRLRAARFPLALAAIVGAALIAALPRLAPDTEDKLVVRFQDQLTHFRSSDYGQIWARAWAMIRTHPWTGQGFDAFRRACAHAPAAASGCNIHPHNFYLEQAINGGAPLVLLFTAMAITTLRSVRPSAGYFVGAVIIFWPVATTSALSSMPNGGWIFLLIGVGLAYSASARRTFVATGPASPSSST